MRGVVINENIVVGLPSTGGNFRAALWLASVDVLVALAGGVFLKNRTPKESDATVREVDWRQSDAYA